jgi:hypothetical protein
MSQFGLLLVTDEATVRRACRGWLPATAEKTARTMINPFTGEPIEVFSQAPAGLDDSLDCASLEEAREALEKAQPICVDFQLHRQLRTDFLNDADKFLFGNDKEGVVSIERVPVELEAKVVEHFGSKLGAYADAANRRAENLAIFVLVYSF